MNDFHGLDPMPNADHPAEALASAFTLSIRRFGGRATISEEVLRTAEMHTELDRAFGHLLIGLDVKVLSHHLLSRVQTQSVGFPANPWQHLKARFGPAWFVRRWPVRKTWSEIVFHVDVDAAFPQAMIPLSETRLGPAAFHESAHFETATYGHPYLEYRQEPMLYQRIRDYYAEAADREARIHGPGGARIRKETPRPW